MYYWSADSVEQELFDLYAPALRSPPVGGYAIAGIKFQ